MEAVYSGRRIAVGMSGGVDSSVAALLLKRQGFDVVGVFMKNWDETDESGVCTATRDFDDVRRVCDKIDIPYYAVNFEKEYMERVFSHFLSEYQRGLTPNPDVLCNREIKFRELLARSLAIGADALATGHYARVLRTSDGYRLLRGSDPNKDQSYFLYAIGQDALAHALFPVGGMVKAQVREIARNEQLATAGKKDSTGICFIGERKFRAFLQQYLPAQPGEMRTPGGQLVGRHDGFMYYTIGQRHGLGIGGGHGPSGEPWFVVGKDVSANILYVAQGEHNPLLYADGLLASELTWIRPRLAPGKSMQCTVKCRYRQPDQPATVTVLEDGEVRVAFARPLRAVTPGQSVVFYDGEECLGGAVIDRALSQGREVKSTVQAI